MLFGQSGHWPGRIAAYHRGLAVLRRRHTGCRVLRTRSTGRVQESFRHIVKDPVIFERAKQNNGSRKLINWNLLVFLVGQGRQSQVLERIKDITHHMFRIIVRQCEVHAAQKFRRSLQLYSVYSRMWGEEAARAMLANFKRVLVSRGRHLLLSAVCFSNFDWKKEKISDESLQRAVSDLDEVEALCKATVECEKCGQRQVIDQRIVGVDYCRCSGNLGYTSESRVYDSWQPFIEREHHIVWRQRHPHHKHLYAYKVYGTYEDVSLCAFMEVQLNTGYRTEWDDSALQLRVLDSQQNSNSDLVYWLVKFPHFFANRDYIFKRRFTVNDEKKEAVIMSEAVHPDLVPEEKGVHRVNEYWSTMVIRAREDVDKPGLEYTLTYFDNPGTSLPQSVTNFIAASAFPNFLKKVHKAALSFQAIHEAGGDVYVSLPKHLRYPRTHKKQVMGEEPIESEEFEESVSVIEDSTVTAIHSTVKPAIIHDEVSSGVEEVVNNKQKSDVGMKTTVQADLGMKTAVKADVDIKIDKQESDVGMKTTVQADVGIKTVIATEGPIEDITNIITEAKVMEVPIYPHCTEELEEPQKEEAKVLLDVIVEDNSNLDPNNSQCQTVESDVPLEREEATPLSDSDDVSEKDSSLSDAALRVHLGRKNISVDLLEAMEVIPPDLKRKTILIEKIEKLTTSLEDFEKRSVVIRKLKKLKDKIKLFQEKASHRKKVSMMKMEELSNRNHYDNLFTDEKTAKLLESLFQAMRDVLQADRDMRTGKGFLDLCIEEHEEGLIEKSDEAFSEPSPTLSQEIDNSGKTKDEENSSYSHNDPNTQLTKHKRKTEQGEDTKQSQHPRDPPPPASGEVSTSESLDVREEGMDSEKPTSSEIETYNSISSSYIDDDSHSSERSSWVYIPFFSRWWDSTDINSSVTGKEPDSPSVSKINDVSSISVLDDSDSNSYASNVWYIISLGWIFHSEVESLKENELHVKEDEKPVNKNDCDSEVERGFKWYWYPVNGVYRAYVWAFSVSRENA